MQQLGAVKCNDSHEMVNLGRTHAFVIFSPLSEKGNVPSTFIFHCWRQKLQKMSVIPVVQEGKLGNVGNSCFLGKRKEKLMMRKTRDMIRFVCDLLDSMTKDKYLCLN